MEKFPFRFVAVPVPFITVYVYICVILPFRYRASVHSNTFSTSGFTTSNSNWNAAAILTPRSSAVRLVVFVVSSLRALRRVISVSALRENKLKLSSSTVTNQHRSRWVWLHARLTVVSTQFANRYLIRFDTVL